MSLDLLQFLLNLFENHQKSGHFPTVSTLLVTGSKIDTKTEAPVELYRVVFSHDIESVLGSTQN